MSTLKVTNIQHPSAESPAIELDATDGVVFSAASFDASAITSGVLDAARLPEVGGLVAVKHVLKTDTFSASLTAGDSEPITDLSITHAVAEAGNKVVLYAQIHGASGTGPQPRWGAGIAVDGVIFRGDADGTRRRVGGSTTNVKDINDFTGSVITLAVVYEPPTTASAIYTAQIMSLATSTQNHYVNRTDVDGNTGDFGRGTSTLTLLEVKV